MYVYFMLGGAALHVSTHWWCDMWYVHLVLMCTQHNVDVSH